MKVYWHPKTRAVRALWMLEELGCDYDRERVDIRSAEPRSGEFLAASPLGKVPALVDGEVRIADSAAICLYLADRYAPGNLAPPADHPDRGAYLFWAIYTPGVIEPAMTERVSGWKSNRGQHGWADFDTMIATWERGLQPGPWILGTQFSAADVMLGSSAVFLQMFDLLPDSKILQSYAERCLARPAYQRALAFEAD